MVNPAPAAVCFFVLALAGATFAIENDTGVAGCWHADLTLLDLPFNVSHGGRWPSMAQSGSITESFFELTGSGIGWTTDRIHNPLARLGALTGLEVAVVLASLYLPGGTTWLHEEFHRAVLSNRGIGSYNTVYDFNPDFDDVSVINVSDEALEKLKAEHPDEFVRLESAGYEAQVGLADALLKDALFRDIRFMEIPALYALVSNTVYLAYCTTPGADAETREFNSRETSIDKRDAIGWDYTAWTYDLHRPDEPYAARGTHPSGVGINRYILWTDLTPSEQRYLRLQAGLSLLNLLRPQLYRIPPLQFRGWGFPLTGSAGLEHDLTPFGFELGLDVFARLGETGFTAALDAYSNEYLTLPGIDCSLIDLPVFRSTRRITWSPRITMWLQPKDQTFSTRQAAGGIFTEQRIDIGVTRQIRIFADLEAKTGGWVAGVDDLGPSVRLGVGGEWTMR